MTYELKLTYEELDLLEDFLAYTIDGVIDPEDRNILSRVTALVGQVLDEIGLEDDTIDTTCDA